jgi:hypothetical protein
MGDWGWVRATGDGRRQWVISRLLVVELVSFSVVGLRSLAEAFAMLGAVHGPTPKRAYREAIEMNRRLARVAPGIEKNDQELLRQLKRAAATAALQIAECVGTPLGTRELRLQTALAAVREVEACLDIASAWGYLPKGERQSIRPRPEALPISPIREICLKMPLIPKRQIKRRIWICLKGGSSPGLSITSELLKVKLLLPGITQGSKY